MKRLEAMIATLIITGIVGVCMLFVGVNALLNPNSVPVSNPVDESAAVVSTSAIDALPQTQINQYNNLISQYQGREKQYQSQVDQLNGQISKLQGVLTDLQRRGVIRILDNGTIQLGRGGRNDN